MNLTNDPFAFLHNEPINNINVINIPIIIDTIYPIKTSIDSKWI